MYYPGVTFLEKGGKVRLKSLDFKKNKKIVISTPKIQLSRKFTLKELMSKYQYTEEEIGVASYIGLFQSKRKSKTLLKRVNFSTGEHYRVYITLYFEPNGKLRMMEIDGYDF